MCGANIVDRDGGDPIKLFGALGGGYDTTLEFQAEPP